MVSGGKFLKLMQKSQIDYPIQGYMSPGKSPKLEKTKLTKLSLMERSEQKNQIVSDLVCQYTGVVPQLSEPKLSDALPEPRLSNYLHDWHKNDRPLYFSKNP